MSRDNVSDALIEATFDHLNISYDKYDIWNNYVEEGVIDQAAVEEVVEHYHPELKEELVDEVESMCGEGQARMFGMWFTEELYETAKEIMQQEGQDADEIEEMLEDYDKDGLVGMVRIMGDGYHGLYDSEHEGAAAIVEDAIEGEQWQTLAKLLVDID